MLDRGINITQLYVDTVGVESIYQDKLQKLFPSMKVVVCKKCDDLYTICSAGSICAKVTRDEGMAVWKFLEPGLEEKIDKSWGSGYPGDARTKEWLQENYDTVFGLPTIARFSWSTVKEISKDKGIKIEWKDDDDDENDPAQLALSFLPNKRQKRHRFFNERKMAVVECF